MSPSEAMEDKLSSLIREVKRLATTPYVPSLQVSYSLSPSYRSKLSAIIFRIYMASSKTYPFQ